MFVWQFTGALLLAIAGVSMWSAVRAISQHRRISKRRARLKLMKDIDALERELGMGEYNPALSKPASVT
jgi:hypothetical protein